ncbi:hypothetical protein BCR44DRAFT_53576 [Catenaria anguillulae PL171]|uniref:Extracellular membrane protein CFEM domain-containing protein n=1 Tax=Catenaria anguillulae PL171 TaxID=765915 RepID=A0A1Y2HQY6_9FUNG|nr:hypothetical protein BCR44DRAFT_53576 [Catenaria anguillulae PL171]
MKSISICLISLLLSVLALAAPQAPASGNSAAPTNPTLGSPSPAANGTTGATPDVPEEILKGIMCLASVPDFSKCFPPNLEADLATATESELKSKFSTQYCTADCVTAMNAITEQSWAKTCPGGKLIFPIGDVHQTVCLKDKDDFCMIQLNSAFKAAGIKLTDTSLPLAKAPKPALCSKCMTDYIAASDKFVEQMKTLANMTTSMSGGNNGAAAPGANPASISLGLSAQEKAERESICKAAGSTAAPGKSAAGVNGPVAVVTGAAMALGAAVMAMAL